VSAVTQQPFVEVTMRGRRAGAAAIWMAVAAMPGSPPGLAQDFSKVEIKVEPVAPGVSRLAGAGGNIALSAGDDGPFIVDDQDGAGLHDAAFRRAAGDGGFRAS
jgi:hypothetical protein